MTLDEAISMEPVKEKLRNLREHMPDETEIVYDFAAYLAERLNSELLPQEFNMAAELALYDLETSIDEYSGKPIPSSLVGHQPITYGLLGMYVPEIAKAVCPEDFANDVRIFYLLKDLANNVGECYELVNTKIGESK